jgi:glycosyltransferase involved in cell wall biosynthesis
MARILVLNNYALDPLLPEVAAGRVPDNLLYGVAQLLSAGHELSIAPYALSQRLCKLSLFLRRALPLLPLGDLDQQWSGLKALRGIDLIYAPCQSQTTALGYLRALGLLRVPIVALAHHSLNYGRLSVLRDPFVRLMLRGIDAFPSLSRGVARQINALSPGKSRPLAWGPPLGFYPHTDGPGVGVISAGRTGRDFVTFGRAASRAGVAARIICLREAVSPEFAHFGANVEVIIRPDRHFMGYPELMQHYAQSRVLAVPLHVSPYSLAGLTSLADALGMGRPIIMTRHPLVDLDIEAEGIGFWVDPGDEQGWARHLRFFEREPQAAWAMGQRAARLAAAEWNSERFAREIITIIEQVLSRSA